MCAGFISTSRLVLVGSINQLLTRRSFADRYANRNTDRTHQTEIPPPFRKQPFEEKFRIINQREKNIERVTIH